MGHLKPQMHFSLSICSHSHASTSGAQSMHKYVHTRARGGRNGTKTKGLYRIGVNMRHWWGKMHHTTQRITHEWKAHSAWANAMWTHKHKAYCRSEQKYGMRVRSMATGEATSQNGYRNVTLVQGASRGLGLEFVKALLSRKADSRVIATCRSPQKAESLQSLQHDFPGRLYIAPLDLTKPESIDDAAKDIKSNFTEKLDMLINVSGILHIQGEMMPETSLSRINYDQMLLSYQTHAIGPALVCKAFWPLMQKSAREDPSILPLMVNISARVGSISDNRLGGWYSYRSSKTALNQLTKTMSVEFERKKPKVATIALHPGTNDTDLSKPFQKNYPKDKIFPKEEGVQKMLKVIDSVQQEDNGKFYAWDGQEIPW